MQTNGIQGKSISLFEAIKEMARDNAKFGLRGVFCGQVLALARRLFLSLNFMTHVLQDIFKSYNTRHEYYTEE